jgi:hypothetical protein
MYHRVVKPYFEKYEDHIDDGINKVASDAQAVAVRNLQGVFWHLMLKSDRIVLDILKNVVQYVLNFDPGTKRCPEVSDKENKVEDYEKHNLSVSSVSSSDENSFLEPVISSTDDSNVCIDAFATD